MAVPLIIGGKLYIEALSTQASAIDKLMNFWSFPFLSVSVVYRFTEATSLLSAAFVSTETLVAIYDEWTMTVDCRIKIVALRF